MNEPLFWLVIVLSVIFGMTNGFIVGGSLVSAVITTRALEPLTALLWVAVCEIGGVFILGQEVARMLAQQLVILPLHDSSESMLIVLVCAVAGALIWNFTMWRLALPTSSGHALVGGLAGSFLGAYGLSGIHWNVFFGFSGSWDSCRWQDRLVTGYGLSRAGYWLGEFLAPAWGRVFHRLQIFALTGVALTHGSNDGQKLWR